MSRITYTAAAWRGFARPAEINSNQIFVNKVKRLCIVTEDINIIDVLDVIDYNRFRKSQYSNHCVHHLLPNDRQTSQCMVLCSRGHQFELTNYKSEIVRKSFFNRMLFKYVTHLLNK